MDNIDNIQTHYEDYFQKEYMSWYDNYKNGECGGFYEFIFAYMTSPNAQENIKDEIVNMLMNKYPDEDHLIDAIVDSIDYVRLHERLKDYGRYR